MADLDWIRKTMTFDDWTAFQEQFEVYQLSVGAPENLALFIKSRPGETDGEIFATGPSLEAIEALSPGGWEATGRPGGEHLSLLVGSGDAFAFFSIE